MPTRNILPVVGAVTTDKVRAVVAGALADVKSATGITNQALAERMGKEHRDSASDLLAGNSTIDLVAFLKLVADSDFGAAFASDILSQTVGMNACSATAPGDSDLDQLPIGVSTFLTAFLKFYANRHLDHQETMALASLLRPMVPHFLAIIAEADRIAG